MKYVFGIVAVIVLVSFSVAMATYVFSGLLMFAGLVALVESLPPLRWFFSRTGSLVDILIFVFSVIALGTMGATVAIGLSVAGLLFSVYYKPYLRGLKSSKGFRKGMSARDVWSKDL